MSRRTLTILIVVAVVAFVYFIWIKPTLASSSPADRDQIGLADFERDKFTLPRR